MLLALPLVLLLCVSCTKEPPRVTLQTSSLSFGCMGGTEDVSVSSNYPWRAVTSATWLTLSQGASTLSVTASPNSSSQSERKAQVMVECEGLRVTLSVSQDPSVLDLSSGTPSELRFDEGGGDYTLTFSTNVGQVEASSSATWISLLETKASDLHPGSLTLRVAPNPSSSSREGTVELSALSSRRSIRVSQDGTPKAITVWHTLWRFSLPYFGEGAYGYLHWDVDSPRKAYAGGLVHEYPSEGVHRISLYLHGASEVSFRDLYGVTDLDLSELE